MGSSKSLGPPQTSSPDCNDSTNPVSGASLEGSFQTLSHPKIQVSRKRKEREQSEDSSALLLLNSLDGKTLEKWASCWKRQDCGIEDTQPEELPECGWEITKSSLPVSANLGPSSISRPPEEQSSGGPHSPQKNDFASLDNKVTQLFVSDLGHESSLLGEVGCLAVAVQQPRCPL